MNKFICKELQGWNGHNPGMMIHVYVNGIASKQPAIATVEGVLGWMRACVSIFFLVAMCSPANAFPKIPARPLPSPNAFDYYVKAEKAVVDELKLFDSHSDLAAIVSDNGNALRLLRAGFQYRCVCPSQRSATVNYSYLANVRSLAMILRAEGRLRGAKGDWFGAASSCIDAIKVGVDIVHGSPEMGMLAGDACQAIGSHGLWDALPHLTATEARTCASRLIAIEHGREPFVDVMREEEWTGQARLLAEFAKPKQLSDDTMNGLGIVNDEPGQVGHATLHMELQQMGKQKVFNAYTRYRDQFVQSAMKPYADKVPTNRVMPDPITLIADTAFKLDPYQSVRIRDTAAETAGDFLIVALALQAYRREHGGYPTSLTDLVSRGCLRTLPDDPFAHSGSLKYQRTIKDYALYSVGPDGIDNHGAAITNPGETAVVNRQPRIADDSKGDIVAGLNLY